MAEPRVDLFGLIGKERPRPYDPEGPDPFSVALNRKLSRPINVEAGESIFQPEVMSRYFDDPSVPEKDKEAIVFALKPSLMAAAFDETVRQSVGGEPIRSKGILGRAISATIDVAGKPVGKIFDALEWPSDRAEQIFGTVLSFGYDADLSLSERWQLGRLTYEAYGQTGWWKMNGDQKLNEWANQVATGEKTLDEIIEENEHGTADLMGKMILDPLWLFGGVPGIPGKVYKAGDKGAEVYKSGVAAGFFRGLAQGIRLEDFGSTGIKATQALKKVPVVGKPLVSASRLLFGQFVPTEEKIFRSALEEWRVALDEEDVEGVITSWRRVKGLFTLTPQAKADHIYNHLTGTITLANANQDDIIQLARAIEAQDLNAVPEVFGTAFRTESGRILFQSLKDQGVELRRFKSMQKNIAPSPEAWDAMEPAVQATLHRSVDAFRAALHLDLHHVAYPALQQWHGVTGVFKSAVLKSGETFERFYPSTTLMQKFTSGMKFWLSTTMLNRPGFAALNYLNNGMTLAFDYGIGRGVRYWLDPFGRRGHLEGAGLKEALDAAGITPQVAKSVVGDRSVATELLVGNVQDKTLGLNNWMWAPMVALTAGFDMGARLHAFYEMYGRAHNATWKFEGAARGLIPQVPAALSSRLGPEVTERLRGAILAAGADPEKIRAIADDILKHGRPPLTAEHFLEKMADELNLADDARQAFMDGFEPAFRARVSAILADAGNDMERLRSRLNRLRGALRQQEHQARELDNLMPRPRDYQNLPVAVADHEALMAERDKVLLLQLRRFLVATGTDPSDAIEGFATILQNSRDTRYVLGYVQQLLDISPKNLEQDILFQMVPEALRGAVKEEHARIVEGVVWEGNDVPEMLADLADRWIDHHTQLVDALAEWANEVDQPLVRDLVDSIADIEGHALSQRDSFFADVINNHPGFDGPEAPNAAEWISTRWAEHYRGLDNLYNEALQRESEIFGFEHRMPPHARAGDNPTVGEMLGARNSQLNQFMDFVERGFPAEAASQPFTGAADGLLEYLDEVAALAPDARRAQIMIARAGADFTMLNYDARYGIDHWMALVYPYAFWPTRSMWHWAQRGLSRPGAVAATAKLYELISDVNEDAGIPERFRNSIRIPIPFLDQALQGGPMYFDPIKVLFPTADWSYDDNFDQVEGAEGTFFGVPRNTIGAVNQWAKVVGPGVNPFIDTALQYAAGDERALYLKYRFSSMPFMIPGPRQLQAMWSFVYSGEDPDGVLDEETKEALATGQHLPENKLKQIFGLEDDEFDLYRTQRVLANMVGEYMKQGHSIEERKSFVREALDAMFTRKGKLWTQARKAGKKEGGLSVVTGWMFGVPIRQYPNGEATSRGIQELYREVQEQSRAEGGGDRTADFTEMFPELEVREAALEIFDGTDKQDQEIAGTLFATDLDRVHKKYDQRIADLNAQLDSLAKRGVLKTEEGRRAFDLLETQRNALAEQRSLEIDDLDKRYEARNQAPSLSRTPRTRALQELEREYYAMELPDSPTDLDFTKQRASQEAFLQKLQAKQNYSPIVAAIRHYEMTRRYDREITAAYDAGDRDKAASLIEERQQVVLDNTAVTKTQISRKEFERYLARNRRIPTSEELERDQASDQISEYFAIRDRATEIGYSSREAAALARSYWESHPLLEKYYGGDLPFSVDSYEDLFAYDRMEEIWEQFYSLEGGSQARIDYLAMVLDELNALRRRFGLRPVRITDPYWNQDAPPPRYEGSSPTGY